MSLAQFLFLKIALFCPLFDWVIYFSGIELNDMLCSQKRKKKVINTMPPFFPNYLTVIISNDISFSILLAMMSKLMFLSIFFNSTNKQPLHSAKFSRFLFGYGPLWLSHLFISWMRFCSHSRINISYGWKSYKTRYSWSFADRIPHTAQSVSFPHGL